MKRTSILCIALGIVFIVQGSARSQSAPHPRLLVTDSLAQEIWARIDTVDSIGEMWRKLEGRARYAVSPSAWWGSFYRYREIEKLALAGLILQNSDDGSLRELGGSYLDRAITICDTVILSDQRIDRSWTQLKAAHRVRALSVVYDFAYDRLGRSQREEFEGVILRDIYGEEGSHSIRGHFMNRANIHSGNHGADWATALLYGAIALEGETEYPSADHPRAYPGRLARAHIDSVRNWMFRSNDCYFKRMFGRDGACIEGLHYGLVNLGYTFCGLQAFSVRDTVDWFRHPRYTFIEDRLSKFDDWIAHETIPHAHKRSSPCDLPVVVGMNMLNDTHNHGDGYDPGEPIFRMLALAGLYGQDAAVWAFQRTRGRVDLLNDPRRCGIRLYELLTAADWIVALLNWSEMEEDDPEMQLANSAYFRDRGLVYWRNGWQDDAIQFAFEGAPAVYANTLVEGDTVFSDRHDQSDKNSFTLYAYGEPFIIDYGWVSTDIREGRTTNENNYIVIDSLGEAIGKGCLTSGRIVEHHIAPFAHYVHGDAKDAFDALWRGHDDDDRPVRLTSGGAIPDFPSGEKGYLNPVDHADRHVQFIRESDGLPPYFVMADDIQKDRYTYSYEWLAQTSHANSIDRGLRTIHIHDDNSLFIYVAHPGTFTTSVEEVVHVADPDRELKRLRIQKTDVVNPFFHLIMVPDSSGQGIPGWDTIPINGGSMAELRWGRYTDHSIFTHGDSIAAGRVRTDARLSLVRKENARDSIWRFVMCGGTRLVFEGRVLADLHGQRGVVVSAGTDVDIFSERAARFTVYAPGAQRVRLNGSVIDYDREGDYVIRR